MGLRPAGLSGFSAHPQSPCPRLLLPWTNVGTGPAIASVAVMTLSSGVIVPAVMGEPGNPQN
jgi:hypothetical protein